MYSSEWLIWTVVMQLLYQIFPLSGTYSLDLMTLFTLLWPKCSSAQIIIDHETFADVLEYVTLPEVYQLAGFLERAWALIYLQHGYIHIAEAESRSLQQFLLQFLILVLSVSKIFCLNYIIYYSNNSKRIQIKNVLTQTHNHTHIYIYIYIIFSASTLLSSALILIQMNIKAVLCFGVLSWFLNRI